MKLESRVVKLERADCPGENAADEIRRADRERRDGTYATPPYIPGQNPLIDAVRDYVRKRDGVT